ncbi:MAG TPA: hypothetical protein DCF49_05155 [Lachnospiraceae bacterium]|nr:hypothetical protein [Lachnospiraceae bacterium]
MPRKARRISKSGYYHVIIRGVDRLDIFLDNNDRLRFLWTLDKCRRETEVDIIVFCLMDNHVHILARADKSPGKMVKKILCSYVPYFNKKYERVGHLFGSRYYGDPLESERAVLAVAKYILRNPVKAGISKVQDYAWSSWQELAEPPGERELPDLPGGQELAEPPGGQELPSASLSRLSRPQMCDTKALTAFAGGKEALVAFVLADDPTESRRDHSFYRKGDDDFRPCRRWSDKEALERIRDVCGDVSPFSISALPKEERDLLLCRLKKRGLTVRQISRLTGIDRNSVQRAESEGQSP